LAIAILKISNRPQHEWGWSRWLRRRRWWGRFYLGNKIL